MTRASWRRVTTSASPTGSSPWTSAPGGSRSSLSTRTAASPSETSEHHMQADVAAVGVMEGAGHGADDLEAERLPQVHGGAVCLDDRVELHAPVSPASCPLQH